MAVATSGIGSSVSTQKRLFAGYTLVAWVCAWLTGIALHAVGIFAGVSVGVWLAVAGACCVLWTGSWVVERRFYATNPVFAWRVFLVVGMLGCWVALGVARATWSDPALDPHSITHYATGAKTQVKGVVATEPDLRGSYRLLTVDVTEIDAYGTGQWQPTSGRIEMRVYGPDDWFAPAYGDTVSLSGKLVRLGASGAAPDVLARLTSPTVTILARGGGNPLLAWLFALRVRLAQGIQHSLPEPEAALLIGILLGLKTPTLRARLPLFTSTGTIHLVVPAGLKVSTLAELATFGVRRFGAWPRTVAALIAVGAYSAVGGGGPAAIRAAIMGALLALAPALGRSYNVFTALAVAVFAMTVVDPLVLYDAGFQLTALATFGLPLLVPPIARLLARWLRRLPGSAVIAELLAVTIAAQIATLPVLALTFHEVSLIAPIANLLTVPLLAPLLVLGGLLALASIAAAPLGTTVALALGWVVWPLLAFVDRVIAVCASLPAAAFSVPNDMPAIFAVAYYLVLAAILWGLLPWLRRRVGGTVSGLAPTRSHAGGGHIRLTRGLLAGTLALALLGAGGAAAPALAASNTAKLAFLDVGAGGEATLLRLPSGVTVLINGGADGPTLEETLAGQLPFWQRSLDVALLTDPRVGDMQGLDDAAAHFSIAHVADAGMPHPSADYIAWHDAGKAAGATYTLIREGGEIQLGQGTTLRALAPPQELYPASSGATAASNDLILQLETHGLTALLLGSADDYALDALAYSGEPLAADVVEVALAPGEPLDLVGPLGRVLALAHPRLVVIANAPVVTTSKTTVKNTPTTADLAPWDSDTSAATQLGATVYRVASAGTITLSGDAQGWTMG